MSRANNYKMWEMRKNKLRRDQRLLEGLLKDKHLLRHLGATVRRRGHLPCDGVARQLSLIVEGHRNHPIEAGPLVEGVTAAEGRRIEMQSHCIVDLVPVLHPMQTNGVVDVGH